MLSKQERVMHAMLAVQRHPWEQGVCAQALLECREKGLVVAMAHEAVTRQLPDGRLAAPNPTPAVTDPASNGEAVLRAWKITGDETYLQACRRMLNYLLEKAPRTDDGVILHNEVSFYEGYSARQLWVDSVYMAPPFLAATGMIDEAVRQIEGYFRYLRDPETGLLRHIYDEGTKRFVRPHLWATGNGWALMGLARVIAEADRRLLHESEEIRVRMHGHRKKLIALARPLIDAMLKYRLADGRFRDILDDESSFPEGTAAMMLAATIYRGVCDDWLDGKYLQYADLIRKTMEAYVDDYGIIHEVCGCPDFVKTGTSAESMAAYLMMHAHWRRSRSCRIVYDPDLDDPIDISEE